MVDGTTDHSNEEVEAVVLRYVGDTGDIGYRIALVALLTRLMLAHQQLQQLVSNHCCYRFA